jgi:hypothetical protein
MIAATMLTSSRRNRMRNRLDAPASPPSLAVFAADRATFLPFLAASCRDRCHFCRDLAANRQRQSRQTGLNSGIE